MTDAGWRAFGKTQRQNRGAGAPVVTPFMRLARVHACGTASDAAIAVTLASSIFFSISPDDSRARVALYLLLTMAPFAVVAPLLGPAIDRARGGRQLMIVVTAAMRAVLAFLMISNIETLWLFPLAFAVLVSQKSYSVAKSAVVPALVKSEQDLVGANSRLVLISAVASMGGAAIAGILSLIGGPSFAAALAMVGFIVTTFLATKITATVVAAEPTAELERAELRDAPVLLAAYATAFLRGIVGFVTFLLAFEFRGGKDGLDVSTLGSAAGGMTATGRDIDIAGDPSAPAWHFGLVLVIAGLGVVSGAKIAPKFRLRTSEERMLQTALAVIAAAALFAALSFDLFGAAVLSGAVAIGASTGKLAFDSLVQRAAPDANYGRSFARFEARFQFAWVIGAFIPAVIPINLAVGGVGVASAAIFALVSYVIGRPATSAVPWSTIRRSATRRNRVKQIVVDDDDAAVERTVVDAAVERTVVDAAAERTVDDAVELTDEDLRPSQPSPPAGTSEWAEGWSGAATTASGGQVDPRQPQTRGVDLSGSRQVFGINKETGEAT